jgi:hypothetical protein
MERATKSDEAEAKQRRQSVPTGGGFPWLDPQTSNHLRQVADDPEYEQKMRFPWGSFIFVVIAFAVIGWVLIDMGF